MKSYIYLLIFFCFSVQSNAQTSLIFKTIFLPDKTYKISMNVEMDSEINVVGNAEIIEQMKAMQMEYPMKLQSEMLVQSTISTKAEQENKIPFEISYDQVLINESINGKKRTSTNPLEKSVLHGYYVDGFQMKIDSIVNSTLDNATKDMLVNVLQKTTNDINFPTQPIKIGDTFDQKIPISIPIPGVGLLSYETINTYTLKEIKDQKALFNLDIQFNMLTDSDMFEIKSSGNGKGKVMFDLENKMIQNNDSSYEMIMKLTKDDFHYKATIRGSSEYRLKIIE